MDVKSQEGFNVAGKVITPMDVLEYFVAIWEVADGYYQEEIMYDWDRNDRFYRDAYPVSKKQSWQSRVEFPIVDNLVTRITQFFVRTLVNTNERFFTVKHDNTKKAQAYTELLKLILRDNKFAEKIFPQALSYAWLNALYVTKVQYVKEKECYPLLNENNELEYNTEVRGRVRIDAIPPRNMRLDPHGENYIIEIAPDVPLAEFCSMAEQNGWVNWEKVKHDILYGMLDGEENEKVERPSNHLPTVDLYYVYTKAITTKSGETLLEDMCFVVANKEYVLDLKYNTGINGDTPYTYHNPMLDVYGTYGRPYISKLRSIIVELINVLNLMSDAAVLSGLGTHEINVEALYNQTAHSVTRDIDPGRQLAKRGGDPLITSSYPPNGIVQGLLQVVHFYRQQLQEYSYQTEFFDGMNTSKGRMTATEVSTKSQQTNSFFTDIATQIENFSLQPTIEKSLYCYLLNMDDESIKGLASNISDEAARSVLLASDYAERLEDIRNLRIEVKGMSGKIQAQANFSKVLQLIAVLGNLGVQGPKADKLVDKGFEVVDDTPDEYYDMSAFANLMQPAPTDGMSNVGGGTTPPDEQVAQAVGQQAALQNNSGV